jgi:hypothetical protein
MADETIVTYTVNIRKAAKDLYYYTAAIQPGGSKVENRKVGEPTKNELTGEESQVYERVETNPPETRGGQALGIGQAMNLVNDMIYNAIENAGMVK